ncbi:MAG: histidine triad nucleotide-binding protein [Acutalibacteraceae bacterium]|nr:histidine triad nucleotide-binding protein [Acutalibacteraceae bacterium]
MDCIFCKIVNGEIPSKKAYEDDRVLAFFDIQPQAPVHIVVIPKEHIESMNGITADNSNLIAHIFEVIPQIAKENGLDDGYRVVSNCGANAGQTVFHIHFHILGGSKLGVNMA